MPDKVVTNRHHPHSPCIEIRETMDDGFSKGFGFHFQPSEDYWIDCHTHLETMTTHEQINLPLAVYPSVAS